MKKDAAASIMIDRASKRFNLCWGRGSFEALRQTNLIVGQAEMICLLGPNGSGKSTLMKLILGLLTPTSGSVTIEGYPAGSMEAKTRIGFLPENPYFPDFLSASELISYYGRVCGLTKRDLRNRTEELLLLVGLENVGRRKLRTFSKGMLQRVGLAQALVHNPAILLLDEPTAGVDPVGVSQMRDLLLQLRENGKTILFSSHLLDHVQAVADRVALLHQGKLLCEGSLEQLLRQPERMEVSCSGLTEDGRQELMRFLQKLGAREIYIGAARLPLEDFFLEQIKSS